MYLSNPGATPELSKQKELELEKIEEKWNELYEKLKTDIGEPIASEFISAFQLV